MTRAELTTYLSQQTNRQVSQDEVDVWLNSHPDFHTQDTNPVAPSPDQGGGFMSSAIPFTIRLAPAVATAEGGPIGAMGAGAGELMAQGYERVMQGKPFRLSEVAAAAGIGAIPAGGPGTVIKQAMKGAALGGASSAIESVVGKQEMPTATGVLGSAALGSVFGAGGQALLNKLKRAVPELAPAIEKELTNVASSVESKGVLPPSAKLQVEPGFKPGAPGMRPIVAEAVPPQRPLQPYQVETFPSIQKMPVEVQGDIANLLHQHSGFEAQRRGVQGWERTEALADKLTVPFAQLKPGTVLNAEELASYKNAVASIMTERQPLAEKIATGQATDMEKLKFSELTDRATVLVASYRGAKAEAGRALNILKNKARVLEYGDEGFIQKALESPGFNGDVERIAQAVKEAGGDPLKQLQILRGMQTTTLGQKGQSLYYASLLSGVKTHVRNMLGNSFNMLSNIVNPIGAAPVDMLRSKIKGTPRTVYMSEVPSNVVGTMTAVPEAFQDAMFVMRHGFSRKAVQSAIEGKFDVGHAELPIGVLNLPMRALDAADVFFRSIGYKTELNAAAHASAKASGAKGNNELASKMSELLTGKSGDEFRQAADTFATRSVFQEKPGAIMQRIIALKNDPAVPAPFRAAMTFVVPFLKTPANILRQGAEFSPMGFAMKATQGEGRAATQAQGRAVLGSLGAGYFAYLAATGQLSGAGPKDAGERAALMEKGWRPNSIKIGDSWVSYNLFQPFSVVATAVANAYEHFVKSNRTDDAAEASATAAIAGAASSFLDQSFLAGLNGLMDAIQDPERNAKKFMSQFAQGLVPGSGLLRNITQAVDPVVRTPETLEESIKAIIPGMSKSIPAKMDRFGRPVERPAGMPVLPAWMQRGFLEPTVSPEKHDPVAELMDRTGVTNIRTPKARLTEKGVPVKLSREQEQAIEEAIGQERYGRLAPHVNNPNMNEKQVRDILEQSTRVVDTRAKSYLHGKRPLESSNLSTRRLSKEQIDKLYAEYKRRNGG